MHTDVLFNKGAAGTAGVTTPKIDVPIKKTSELIPEKYLRSTKARLPEVSEAEVVRHFVNLSTKNHHVDKAFYPLGSCTMKYNPKINEETQGLPGFQHIHPEQPTSTTQGALKLLADISEYLCEISGLKAVTMQPAAGAHGELAGLMLMRAYHKAKGNERKNILFPDSAHGTNPASVSIAGFNSVHVKSNDKGLVDIDDLKSKLDENTAGFMLTNPNTLGIFESQVKEIAKLVHDVDGLMYMDGANMNALLGIVRPGDLDFDVLHFNLHKTFSTPHGGGGPGSGPVGVSDKLVDFLPNPCVIKENDDYKLCVENPNSIGKMSTFYGNFGVIVRAYTYIRMLGAKGLREVGENALINANYLLSLVKEYYDLAYAMTPMHEFVLSGSRQKKFGVKTLDIAKRLLDFGVHAPTVYFPLIVPEAIMIEPTETESKASIEHFASCLVQIAKEAENTPEIVKNAPSSTPVTRLNEAMAAKNLNVKHNFDKIDE